MEHRLLTQKKSFTSARRQRGQKKQELEEAELVDETLSDDSIHQPDSSLNEDNFYQDGFEDNSFERYFASVVSLNGRLQIRLVTEDEIFFHMPDYNKNGDVVQSLINFRVNR